MAERIRITGGTIRNRRLLSPPRDSIRPASDMIRQAVFNMLGDRVAGTTFFDVFAGTGVVGLEALSRGARQAVFVERDRDIAALLRKNLALGKFPPAAAQLRQLDAHAWAAGFRPAPGRNIVFLGPPYPPFADAKERAKLDALVAHVQAALGPEDYLILQYPKEIFPEALPGQPSWIRGRKYGKTRIGIWRAGGVADEAIRTDGALSDDDDDDADDDEEFLDDEPAGADPAGDDHDADAGP